MSSSNIQHYLGRGLAAARPVSLDLAAGSVGIWLSTDTSAWSAWTGSSWVALTAEQPDGVTVPAGTSGTLTLDLAGGANKNFRLSALTGNATLAVTNLAAAGRVSEFECLISQGALGGHTLSLPAAFRPLGQSDTAIATAADAKTVLSAKTFDGGATWMYAMQDVG